MSELIDKRDLIKKINEAEENFRADHMESICSGDGDPFVDGVLSGVFSLRTMTQQMQAKDIPSMMRDIYLAGVNMDGEYHGCWVRFKDIENIINHHLGSKDEETADD